jgi:hypothetical protein
MYITTWYQKLKKRVTSIVDLAFKRETARLLCATPRRPYTAETARSNVADGSQNLRDQSGRMSILLRGYLRRLGLSHGGECTVWPASGDFVWRARRIAENARCPDLD